MTPKIALPQRDSGHHQILGSLGLHECVGCMSIIGLMKAYIITLVGLQVKIIQISNPLILF